MKPGLLMLKIFLVVSVLFSFVSKGIALDRSRPPEPATKKTQVAEKEAGKIDWETILKKARQEGEIAVIGGTSVGGLRESIKLFKDKFGINLLITTDRGSSITTKLMQERRNGLYLQDVMISGQTTMTETLKPAGIFDPLPPALALPEVLDQKLWYDGRFDWVDEGRYIFNFALYPHHMVVINTDLVKPGEIQSYHDLLNPKWKDKIVINDPTITGIGNAGYTSMVYNSQVTMDFFRQLAAQKNILTRDQDLQATWLAKGKYPITLWPSLGAMARFMEAGAPIKPIVSMKEGAVAGATGCALSIFNRAPHPNAARVFINWFLSREGQALNQKSVRKQTRRVDVATEGLDPFETRIPGVKYLPEPSDKEHYILNEQARYNKLAEQIFAPLK